MNALAAMNVLGYVFRQWYEGGDIRAFAKWLIIVAIVASLLIYCLRAGGYGIAVKVVFGILAVGLLLVLLDLVL